MRTREAIAAGRRFAKVCIDTFSGERVEGFGRDEPYLSEYVGTVFNVMPSGKYYMPWSTNVTEREANLDEAFTDGMEAYAFKRGFWFENGEGDPCDMFCCTNCSEE